ncbi:ABC transporter permease [Sinirhodobacter populi]|uniref:ABC transporter permease n=2 Tax=Paenirhodobacter populi TaxID=2306993 RepID=A0A443KNR2_9RHOB|nr:ABC transporter permease [Sinirhodobacter populi]
MPSSIPGSGIEGNAMTAITLPMRRIARRHPGLALGAAILAALCLLALCAPLVTPVDPGFVDMSQRAKAPSWDHIFGTDMLGRDLFARIVYGGRLSLSIGAAVALIATVAGTVIGLVAGYVRLADAILMRIMDGVMSIPSVLLAVALMALSTGSIGNVIVAISISGVPRIARLVRGSVLSLREAVFVEAVIGGGVGTGRIIFRHILPNAAAPIIVNATYLCAGAMLSEAVLCFIGAGTPPTVPSWGNIMAEGRTLWMVKPHIVAFPALILSIAILAVNMVGDGLRDMLDPRAGRRN